MISQVNLKDLLTSMDEEEKGIFRLQVEWVKTVSFINALNADG